MRGHKPDSLQPLNLIDLSQKLGKGNRRFQVFSIRIHILSQKHNLYNAVCHQLSDFIQDILRPAASLSSPHIGNNTVAAEVIAAKHNIDS